MTTITLKVEFGPQISHGNILSLCTALTELATRFGGIVKEATIKAEGEMQITTGDRKND